MVLNTTPAYDISEEGVFGRRSKPSSYTPSIEYLVLPNEE